MAVVLPSLHITLGLHMDGAPYPLAPASEVNGRSYGPNGFLGQLEAWLGLPPFEDIAQSRGQRIALCMRAAGELCKPHRGRRKTPFYKESFDKAKWSTAKRLLFMLDSLLEAGWTGEEDIDKDTPPNLVAFKKLYNQLREEEFQSPVCRLERVLQCLRQKLPLPHDVCLALIEDRALWPRFWRDLFDQLEKYETKDCLGTIRKNFSFAPWDLQKMDGASDNLHKLHEFLRALRADRKATPSDNTLSRDESLILLEGDAPEAIAESVALLLKHQSKVGKRKTVLLYGTEDPTLDEALARFHLPVSGHALSVQNNEIFQILPICLRLHWEPFSVQTLMDFLSLRYAPVDKSWRCKLRNALHHVPGIGNEYWEKAVAKINESMAADKKSPEEIDNAWKDAFLWMRPAQNAAPDDGLKKETILDVCQRLETWVKDLKGKTATSPLFAIMEHQCREFASLVEKCGEERFKLSLLESLLEQVAPSMPSAPAKAQAAPWTVIEHPGQICTPCDTLVWWPCTKVSSSSAERYLWTEEELAWLKKLKKPIVPDTGAWKQRSETIAFCNALRLTARHCILVLPKFQYGEETEPHPMLDAVDHFLGANQGLELIRRTPEEILLSKTLTGKPDTVVVAPRSTPSFEKEWKFPERKFSLPASLSPSKLKDYFLCPFSLMLSKIDEPDYSDNPFVADAAVWLGNLAHHLLEKFASEPCKKNVASEMAERIKNSIDARALPLNQPEFRVDREDFLKRLPIAAEFLAKWIQEHGGKSFVSSEEKKEKAFSQLGTKIYGAPDMVWQVKDKRIVWDLKWSASNKYRDWLNAGEAWQLVAYTLLFDATDVAYWLLKKNELVGTENSGAEEWNTAEIDLQACCKTMEERLTAISKDFGEGTLKLPQKYGKDCCTYCSLGYICGGSYA